MPDNKHEILSTKVMAEKLPDLKGGRVLIVGDVMLDHYVVGGVERISPEAPVPVVTVSSESQRLGGAGNVAKNIKGLGGEPVLISVLGEDADGARLDQLLAESAIQARMIRDAARPTTRKIRIIAHNQQVVRVDWENSSGVSGKVQDRLFAQMAKELPGTNAILLSDYGKGVITAGFMRRLWRLFEETGARPAVFVDPKVRNFGLYKGVSLLTPNAKEAAEGAGVQVQGRSGVLKAGIEIFKKLKCEELLITLGADGMALFMGPDKVWHISTSARKVFDVTGAGDTVIATAALAKAAGLDTLSACVLANFAAGIVVGEIGTVAVDSNVLGAVLARSLGQEVDRWL